MQGMQVIKIFNRYSNALETLMNNIVSKYEIQDFLEDQVIDEGIALIEITIPYIENIYRNPNRLIVNEEEIVKIELAKRVTVESVKHLSRNTNFIQSIDEETKEVTPSKILNIIKEETYFTYENKLIYTLIQNVKFFVKKVEDRIIAIQILADNPSKSFKYSLTKKQEHETIEVDFSIKTKVDEDGLKDRKRKMLARIEEINKKLQALENYDAYKIVDKKHIQLIKPPIKKTNLILKNVNFNYAMKLWDFIQEFIMLEEEKNKQKKKNVENENIRQLFDEITMLAYVVLKESNEDEEALLADLSKDITSEDIKYDDLSDKKVNEIILNQIKRGEFKDSLVEKQIRTIFLQYINEYLGKKREEENDKKNKK